MGKIKKLILNENEIIKIEDIIKNDHRYRVRKRATAILLRSKEIRVQEMVVILKIRAEQIYKWISKFKKDGVNSFYDKPGRGKKAILRDSQIDTIKEIVINQPSIRLANMQLKEKLNINVADITLLRYVKKNAF